MMNWLLQPLSNVGPGTGEILDLFAIGILLIAAYHYIRARGAETSEDEMEARRNLAAIVLIFVFYAAVSHVYWSHTDASVTLIGRSVELYFDQVAANVVVAEPTSPEDQNLVNRLVDVVQTIGLIGYVFLAGATAIVGSAPLKLLDALAG